MRNTNKKGFTIVELVIVIAVIAILAAVLIPTFAGIIAKANQSSDIQATRQMNTALAVAGDLDDIDDVIDALAEAGFNSKDALIPVSTGYTFYWYANAKQIVLENDKGEVVFPEGVTKEDGISLENSVKYIDVAATDAESLINAVLSGHNDIKLDADINIGQSALNILAGSNVAIDLNEKTLTTDISDSVGQKHAYAFSVSGNLTLSNGTINARGIEVLKGGKLVVDNVTVNAIDNNGGMAFWVKGGEVVINSGTFTVEGDNLDATDNNVGSWDPTPIQNAGGKVTINGGKFVAKSSFQYVVNNMSGETIINGGEFEGARGVVFCENGSVTINNGTFTKTSGTVSAHIVAQTSGGQIKINGGSFNCKYLGTNGIDDFNSVPDENITGNVTVNGEAYKKAD